MTGFIDYDIVTDEQALISRVFAAIRAAFPDWSANEAHLEVVLTEELVRSVAEARAVAADVPKAIFNAFGEKLVKLPRVLGSKASARTTWTALDNAGYTIPAGTLVGYRAAGDALWLFDVVDTVAVPAGATTITDVEIRARELGTTRNGVPVAAAIELVDALAWVDTIVTTSVSSGGIDPETDDEYLDRLAEELSLLAPRPILPHDFEILARETPGVYRARAIDGYNPGDSTSGNDRMIAMAAVDEGGVLVAAPVKAAMQADLDARREVNFVVNAMDPQYTVVDVTFAAKAVAGYDPDLVEAQAIDVLGAYLHPANWAGGDESPPSWRAEDIVRRLEVASVLGAIEGLAYVTTLTMGKNGGAQSTADVALDGVAPLPQPGAILGTVT